jgi:hypothetical protein
LIVVHELVNVNKSFCYLNPPKTKRTIAARFCIGYGK